MVDYSALENVWTDLGDVLLTSGEQDIRLSSACTSHSTAVAHRYFRIGKGLAITAMQPSRACSQIMRPDLKQL